MDALAYAKLHPKAFHHKYFQKGVRPDMRQLLQFRDVSVSTGSIQTADSSALVRLGDTVSPSNLPPPLCVLKSARWCSRQMPFRCLRSDASSLAAT